MIGRAGLLVGLAALAAAPVQAGQDKALPRHVGECVDPHVKDVGTRLVDGDQPVPDSGSAIQFTNGGYQVSYETVPAVEASRAGDAVKMCLIAIPHGCPPGDNRGREYRVNNLRTHKSWLLPDAEHMCGGA
jgi:hypothetical protein